MEGPLSERVDRLPDRPGVYLFVSAGGTVLYVGKASRLRSRVRQYLTGHDGRPMVPHLVRAAVDVRVTLVDTEKEALLLENTLIKKHRPRYNTRLVDDANFLHLWIDPDSEWPDFHLVRRLDPGRGRVFGPYPSASRARSTLDLLNRRFPLRTCSDQELRSRKRPCLLHQMNRCLAPCVGLCSTEEYGEVVQQSLMFLEGRNSELLDSLREQMLTFSEQERFEDAARVRDLVFAVEKSIEHQQVVDEKRIDRDTWGLFRELDRGMVSVTPVRKGFMQEALVLPLQGAVGEDGEVLSSLLNQWYDQHPCPSEVLVPAVLADQQALEEVLTERRGRRVHLHCPQRGHKSRLVTLASKNARSAFQREHTRTERSLRAVEEL
ncbi:MAG: excinuclease ABC subunit UvrC, partial [Myxococcota bacterium]|nr:excinuclease ABC subunit UvrC [Myxococcota bacterium]